MGNANAVESDASKEEAAEMQAYSDRQPQDGRQEPRDTLPLDESAVPWRTSAVQNRSQRIFLDVIDELEVCLNSSSAVLSTRLQGSITVRCELSGMPRCILGLTPTRSQDKPGAERFPAIDINYFHPCVDQARFSSDRNIQFIPPDGEFELLRFHPSQPPSSPLFLHPPVVIVDVRVHSSTATTATLSLSACLQRAERWPASADEVQIRIPVPVGLQAGVFKQPLWQRSALVLEEQAIVWTISRPRPDKQYTAQASFQRVTGAEVEDSIRCELPAITVELTLNEPSPLQLTGVQFLYLKIIERAGYKAQPYARYCTRVTCRQPHPLTLAQPV